MLPYALSSVAVARQRLCADLLAAGVPEPIVDDVVLVLSELLSNALRHAHPLASGQLKATWSCLEQRVEVAVSDGGAATEPRAGRPTLSSLGGRGLGIVDYLAERWGVRHEPDAGTTVWAIVAIHGDVQNNGINNAEIRTLREVG
ncbi:ATP-binding protein [Streptosporangiaceae bacterium NEAU-GS5]|nr:ATP-binding protein [Streptosporangiaceae bacterium NEAU-GS5]